MKIVSNKKWEKVNEEDSEKIKSWLILNGGVVDDKKTSQYESWRIK